MTQDEGKLKEVAIGKPQVMGIRPMVDTGEESTHPTRYKVILFNDDFTPMEFVVELLETIFHMANPLASKIMLDVHKKGSGLCGIYPYEIAETKVALVLERARKHRHPLKCTMEEE